MSPRPRSSPGAEAWHVGHDARRVHVVLVRPENPANVGAAARAMRNTGMAELRLVSPGDWRTVECWRSAWGAHELLESARVFDDLPAALADVQVALALSGRPGARAADVREAAAELAALPAERALALVFGPETSGLRLDELAACGRTAVIPAHPAQPSLNLAQAVMVACHELYRARCEAADEARPARAPDEPCVPHGTIDATLELLRQGMLAVRALPHDDPERHFRHWRAFFHARAWNARELRGVEHVARRMLGAGRARRHDERAG